MKAKELLTERELQIAKLIAWGANRKEVPALLVAGGFAEEEISIYTVNNVVASIYAKLSLNTETELAAWWFCEVEGVDSSKSPLKALKERLKSKDTRRKLYAFIFLLILMPQVTNLDQAIRPARTSAARTTRTQGSRRGKEEALDITDLLQ